MDKQYALLFCDITGALLYSVIIDNPTEEKIQMYISKGYEIVSKEIYDLVLGNVDGKARRKNLNGEGYIVYEAPLEDVKRKKINSFKNKRDYLEIQPIEVNNNLFDYDNQARDRISAAIIALEGQDPIQWTTADNQNVLVSANDLKDVVRAVAVRSNVLHVKYRQLKEQVLAATTKEEVDAITWTD